MKSRKPKTSDKDIKAFFQDYNDAEARIKVIKKKLHYTELTEEDKLEILELNTFRKCIEDIVDSLDPLERIVIRSYYLEKKNLTIISQEINYGYEYTSYIKIKGDSCIRGLIAGNVFKSELSNKLINNIREIINKGDIKNDKGGSK